MRRGALAASILCVALAAITSSAGNAAADEPTEVLVFAGSASKPVLEAAAERIEKELGIRLLLNLGGSGSMLSQLELGHRGDIYLPGSHDYIERAVARHVVDPTSRVDFAYLVPALLVQTGNPLRIHTLADLERPDVRAAIAEPRTVCVGAYAEAVLERAGLADKLMPRLGRARSCAGLANLLALGNVDAIIGWRVFAAWYPDRLEIVPLPPPLVTHVAAVPGAVTTFAAHPEAARRVLAWLAGREGRALWRAHRYLVTWQEALALAPEATAPR